MDEEELTNLVARALNDTSKFDSDVGGKFNMALINEKNGLREFTEASIKEMIED